MLVNKSRFESRAAFLIGNICKIRQILNLLLTILLVSVFIYFIKCYNKNKQSTKKPNFFLNSSHLPHTIHLSSSFIFYFLISTISGFSSWMVELHNFVILYVCVSSPSTSYNLHFHPNIFLSHLGVYTK